MCQFETKVHSPHCNAQVARINRNARSRLKIATNRQQWPRLKLNHRASPRINQLEAFPASDTRNWSSKSARRCAAGDPGENESRWYIGNSDRAPSVTEARIGAPGYPRSYRSSTWFSSDSESSLFLLFPSDTCRCSAGRKAWQFFIGRTRRIISEPVITVACENPPSTESNTIRPRSGIFRNFQSYGSFGEIQGKSRMGTMTPSFVETFYSGTLSIVTPEVSNLKNVEFHGNRVRSCWDG